MMKFLLTTSGSGSLIDWCLGIDFFKESICSILSDRECGAEDVAIKHNVKFVKFLNKDLKELNDCILKYAIDNQIDYILSHSYVRLFKGEILGVYRNKIINSHFSILPAFKGYYDTRDKKRKYQARQIFERTLEFGSRISGNTVHIVNEEVDDGAPILVSVLNIPYNEEPKNTRHRLFIHECKSILQVVSWINGNKLGIVNGKPIIKDAKFKNIEFSPNLDNPEALNFNLKTPPTN